MSLAPSFIISTPSGIGYILRLRFKNSYSSFKARYCDKSLTPRLFSANELKRLVKISSSCFQVLFGIGNDYFKFM